jgi:hypothetical protein
VLLKVTISWRESSRKTKRGSTILSQRVRVNARVWNGNFLTRLPRENTKNIRLQGSLCLQFWAVFTTATVGTLSREGSTVHSARYSGTLCDKLKHAVRRLLWEGDLLLPNNASRHTAAHTGLKFSVTWRRVFGWVFPDVLKYRNAFIFRDRQSTKRWMHHLPSETM